MHCVTSGLTSPPSTRAKTNTSSAPHTHIVMIHEITLHENKINNDDGTSCEGLIQISSPPPKTKSCNIKISGKLVSFIPSLEKHFCVNP